MSLTENAMPLRVVDRGELMAIAEIVGASFTELTVGRKIVLLVLTPSLTVSVINVVPNMLGAGVTVTVRAAALPPTKHWRWARARYCSTCPPPSGSSPPSRRRRAVKGNAPWTYPR